MRCCDHAGLTAWMCDDGWLLSLRHEVLHVFLSRVSLMGIYIGHISSNIYTLYRLCLPSPPSADIPVLPREGAISQVALYSHQALTRTLFSSRPFFLHAAIWPGSRRTRNWTRLHPNRRALMGMGQRNEAQSRAGDSAHLSFHRGTSRNLQGHEEDAGNKFMFI